LLKKDLLKNHKGKSKLDKMLSAQKSPNDKSGLGFISNNKKSKIFKKKKSQEQVKDPPRLFASSTKLKGIMLGLAH
jgi:hypothetical protein